jgi:hypothetical protein
VPSTPPLQKVAPAGGALHVPRVWPAAIVQTPPQQSGAARQASPFWMQNDDALEQRPPAQSAEQHSELVPHSLPDVLHADVNGLHAPPAQSPLQHSPPEAHACPSEVHAWDAQWPPAQASEQQSRPVVHDAPDASHWTGDPPRHEPARGSQRPEQQSASPPQRAPAATQKSVPPTLASAAMVTEPVAPPHPPQTTAATRVATSRARLAFLIGSSRIRGRP